MPATLEAIFLMSAHDTPRPLDEGGLHAPAVYGPLRKVWWWFHFAILVKLARLRFLAILAVIGALIVYWDTLAAYYEKWTRPLRGTEQVAASDVEYFCPMHPQVVTSNPKEKCPICFMNLTKRKKGEGTPGEALPPGVVHRLQLSPYKVVAAGIRTREVGYKPLVKKIETVGTVEFDERKLRRISARVKGRIDKLFVNFTGQDVHPGDELARIYSPDLVTTVQNLLDARSGGSRSLQRLARDRLRLWGIDDEQIRQMERTGKRITHLTLRSPVHGYVRKKYQVEGDYVEESAPILDLADLSTVWVEAQVYEQDMGWLKVGQRVRATAEGLPGRAFEGKISFLYPHLDQASRTLRVRFDIPNPDHQKKPEASLRPGMFATVRIDIPATQLGQSFPTRGDGVLAVPEDAVVYTGSRKIVFRQEGETTFDAVQVELGPLAVTPAGDTFYPVLKGLQEGEKVASVGSYLLDAENRVSAAAGSIYYGGGGASSKSGSAALADVRPSTPEDVDLKVKANLAKLSTPDRRLAEAQKRCPIQGGPLGGMGPLVKLNLKGQPVFLCCKGCVEEAKRNPEKTLAEVERLKEARATPATAAGAQPGVPAEKLAKVKANLAKLRDADQRLAEAQKYCAVQGELLGSMGKPIKVLVQGKPVFVCCAGCEDDALADPAKTLATVEKLKAKAAAEAAGKGGPP
jgi:multidrug efflux pump subunit AcrA (membrane-fusion protein)